MHLLNFSSGNFLKNNINFLFYMQSLSQNKPNLNFRYTTYPRIFNFLNNCSGAYALFSNTNCIENSSSDKFYRDILHVGVRYLTYRATVEKIKLDQIGSKDISQSVISSIQKIGIPFPCKSHHTDLFDHETKVWLNATF